MTEESSQKEKTALSY